MHDVKVANSAVTLRKQQTFFPKNPHETMLATPYYNIQPDRLQKTD